MPEFTTGSRSAQAAEFTTRIGAGVTCGGGRLHP
jgi:hypothetical protein